MSSPRCITDIDLLAGLLGRAGGDQQQGRRTEARRPAAPVRD
jgi:hypothetical protein